MPDQERRQNEASREEVLMGALRRSRTLADDKPTLSEQERAVYYGLGALGIRWPKGTANGDIAWLARLLVAACGPGAIP